MTHPSRNRRHPGTLTTTAAAAFAMTLLAATGACSNTTTTNPAPSTPTGAASSAAPHGPWKAAQPASAPKLTEAQKQASRTRLLTDDATRLKTMYKITVGRIPALIRWTTRDEYPTTIADCMKHAGYTVTPVEGGILYPDNTPTSQQGSQALAYFTCTAHYSEDPTYMQNLTPAQLTVQYHYDIESLIPCLASHGYPLSDTTPPTLGTFLSTKGQWYPFALAQSQHPAIAGDNLPAAIDLEKACPRNAPMDQLYA